MNKKLFEVITLWQNDIDFRTEFEKNPAEALKRMHMELNESDLREINDMIKRRKDLQNDPLDGRISK